MDKLWKMKNIKAELNESSLFITGNGEINFKGAFAPWFSHKDEINEVIIGPGITKIQDNTFENFVNLNRVIVIGSTEISKNAFIGCYNINFTNNVPEEEMLLIKECGSCDLLYIGSGIAMLTPKTSKSYKKLDKKVYITGLIIDSITDLPSDSRSKSFSTKVLMNSVNDAFSAFDVDNISFIILRADLSLLFYATFLNVREIYLSNEVSSDTIDFYFCEKLVKAVLPETLKEIKSDSFTNCSSLSVIKMPPVLKCVGSFAFSGCTSLKKIKFTGTNIELKKGSFSNCPSLEEVIGSEKISIIGSHAFENATNLKTFKFGKNLKEIGYDSFSNSGIETADLSNTKIEKIKPNSFDKCASLKKIILPSEK